MLVRDVIGVFFRRREVVDDYNNNNNNNNKKVDFDMSPKSKKSCFALCFVRKRPEIVFFLRLESSWDKARAVGAKEELEKLTKD